MTQLQKQRIHRLATLGAQQLLKKAGALLEPHEEQVASAEIYQMMVELLYTLIVLERSAIVSIEPSVN